MLHRSNRAHAAGALGMFGAALFIGGLLMEYRFGLFPPGSGALYVINQIMFLTAMACILVMLWQMRGLRLGGHGRFARITFTLFPIGWGLLIAGGVVSLLTGSSDTLLYPLGGLTTLLFGLLAGIAAARNHNWPGRARFALWVESVYYALVMMILPPIVTGSNEPT